MCYNTSWRCEMPDSDTVEEELKQKEQVKVKRYLTDLESELKRQLQKARDLGIEGDERVCRWRRALDEVEKI